MARKPISHPDAPRRWRVLRIPAVQALLIQCLSLPLVLMVASGLSKLVGIDMSVASAALLQGVFCMAASKRRGLAPWWWVIQLLFPFGLLAVLTLRLPSWIYLTAFLFLLVLYWSTFRTQVPFYPSGPAAWRAVAGVLPQGRPVRFIDIGSGFGGLVMHLAASRPDSSFSGIELAPLPWLASRARATLRRSAARFIHGDYTRLDFAVYDVIFAYLSPVAMPMLWEKAQREMRPGAVLLSYEFMIPGAPPSFTIALEGQGPRLYGWEIGGSGKDV